MFVDSPLEKILFGLGLFTTTVVMVTRAHADLSLSSAATQNVSCQAARCIATAGDAVMNTRELHHLLREHRRVVLEAGSAKNISVDAPFSWTSSATLELKARKALTFNKPMTVAGTGGVVIATADGGLSFPHKASLTFWDVSSSLAINGIAYKLEPDLPTLIADGWQNNFSGAMALARDYDASGYNYWQTIDFLGGRLEGLGHTIDHLTVQSGAFIVDVTGTLSNLNLLHATTWLADGQYAALAAERNHGVIDHVSVAGTLYGDGPVESGGLTGENEGLIRNSNATVNIVRAGYQTGGLASVNGGTIANSWANGKIHFFGVVSTVGGLTGINGGTITNSYSLAHLLYPRRNRWTGPYGGVVGTARNSSQLVNVYEAGQLAAVRKMGTPGGVVGWDSVESTYTNAYWDTDSGALRGLGFGADNSGKPGIVGLSTQQLQAGLPPGFNPKVWTESRHQRRSSLPAEQPAGKIAVPHAVFAASAAAAARRASPLRRCDRA